MPFRSGVRRSRVVLALASAGSIALLLGACAGGDNGAAGGNGSAGTAHAATNITLNGAKGGVSGGGSETIEGNGLDSVATVDFGAVAATIKPGRDDHKLAVTVPPAANFTPGSVAVSLLDKAGKKLGTAPEHYTYAVISPVDKQMVYAMTYWKNYNSATYGNLNPVGGDCANFVSQTLLARGWKMNDDWYNHDAAADWAPAWGYVPAMDNYFSENQKQLGLTEVSFDQADRGKIALGDVAIFDWNNNDSPDHVQVVTGIAHVDGKIKITMASHNDDGAFRDLDQEITVQHPGGIGHFWHLTK